MSKADGFAPGTAAGDAESLVAGIVVEEVDMRIAPVVILATVALLGCESPTHEPPPPSLAGTWGGDNAGLIATDSSAHVHIGCTVGDIDQALLPGPTGRFDVPGLYNITAFPVYRPPDHPARFSGLILGRVMFLTVTLTDTAVTLGPLRLTLGAEPKMGPCPICRTPTPIRMRHPLIGRDAISRPSGREMWLDLRGAQGGELLTREEERRALAVLEHREDLTLCEAGRSHAQLPSFWAPRKCHLQLSTR